MGKPQHRNGRVTPKGTRPAGTRPGFKQLAAQAAELQQQMTAARAEVAATEMPGTAGGGAVRVVMMGDGTPVSVHIDPSVIDPDDPGLLEDLILLALRDSFTKSAAAYDEIDSSDDLLDGINLADYGIR